MQARTFCGAAVVVTLLLLAPRSAAQNDIYDNGPTDGYTLGWTINFGFAVSDSFTISGNVNLASMQFAAWLFPGDVLQTAELAITSSEFGGTTYFNQIVSFTANGCFNNGSFNVCNEDAFFTGVALNAGTYWLTLANAVVNSGDPVYWDMNSGPSLASESSVGTIPSESFTVGLGCGGNAAGCGPPPPTTPEPGSLPLFISGIAVSGLALAGVKSLR